MSEALIEIEHVEKVYHRDTIEIPVLDEIGRASCRERVYVLV